jgi:leucyl aminopeptidase (aminopeptidase T)
MAPEESAPVSLARRLLGPVLSVKAGENVTIESWNHTLPFAAACVAEARDRGAHPLLLLEEESAFWRGIEAPSRTKQHGGAASHEIAALSETDAYVYFSGPADRPRWRGLPEFFHRAREPAEAVWLRTARKAGVRVVHSRLGDASDPQAAFWGVSVATWRGQILRGCLQADLRQIQRDGRRARDLLHRGKVLRLTAANGTDVSFRLRGRAPVLDDGVAGPDDLSGRGFITDAPGGRVVVAVEESSAEGVAIGNRPSYLPWGRADGGQWEIQRGRLENAWFNEGHHEFEDHYSGAPKGREMVGLFAVGLNAALPAGTPQLEDEEAGAVTIGLGGNTAYGGTNVSRFLAWLVVGEATVAVDGRPLVDRGKVL